MYEHVAKEPRSKRDRALLVTGLVALALLISVVPFIIFSLNSTYTYHRFEVDFSKKLTAARHVKTDILLSDGETERTVSADAVSNAFRELTDHGVGDPQKSAPVAEHLKVTLPDGTTLTFYNTPQQPPEDDADRNPRGTTVEYRPADGKPYIYLQRTLYYSTIAAMLQGR